MGWSTLAPGPQKNPITPPATIAASSKIDDLYVFQKVFISYLPPDYAHFVWLSSAAFNCSIAFTTVALGHARLNLSNCAVAGPNTLPLSNQRCASSTIMCSNSSSVKPYPEKSTQVR